MRKIRKKKAEKKFGQLENLKLNATCCTFGPGSRPRVTIDGRVWHCLHVFYIGRSFFFSRVTACRLFVHVCVTDQFICVPALRFPRCCVTFQILRVFKEIIVVVQVLIDIIDKLYDTWKFVCFYSFLLSILNCDNHDIYRWLDVNISINHAKYSLVSIEKWEIIIKEPITRFYHQTSIKSGVKSYEALIVHGLHWSLW